MNGKLSGFAALLRDLSIKSAKPVWAAEQIAALAMLAVMAWALFIAGSGWYPVGIQSDFSELDDTFITSGAGPDAKTISRAKLLPYLQWLDYETCQAGGVGRCVQIYVERPDVNLCRAASPAQCIKPDVPKPQDVAASDFDETFWKSIDTVIRNTGLRQPSPGGVLYHHASVYVPAAHLLKYGLSAPIPYLYGLGSTAVYSLLFAMISPTISTYFNVYPFMILIGIISIFLAAAYATRSPVAGVSALSLCAWTVFSLGFGFIILSAGFNPMRYAGLSAQVASLFYLYRARRSALGIFGLFLSLVFSLIWNTEFGLFGAVGQMLAVLSPSLSATARQRFASAIFFIATVVTAVFLRQASTNLHTNDLMYFGVLTPKQMEFTEYRDFLLYIAGSVLALTLATLQFKAGERSARLCLLPILIELLVKYIYIPQKVHLFSSLVFILPMLLIYVPWPRFNEVSGALVITRRIVTIFACATLVNLCVPKAANLRAAGIGYRDDLVVPFKSDNWRQLGETIRFAAPSRKIADRVKMIRAELRPSDTVAMLSPFDYLLAFYAAPKNFCGHFEILTNLATTRDIDTIARCIQTTPNVLVVYDKALNIDCPKDDRGDSLLFIDASCKAKELYKRDIKEVFERTKNGLRLVNENEDIALYRRK